jgi:serine/threonine protein kinase
VENGSLFLVYEYLDTTLKDVWDRTKLSRISVVQIGIQLIAGAESIHSAGYVHADLKLDNIMIDGQNKVFIIDYGNCEKFLLPDGTHRLNGSGPDKFVNVHFGSKNAMNKETLSRRDDLIQIIYNLICLVNSFKPLIEYIGPDTYDLSRFRKYKKKRSALNFCARNKTP